MMAFQKRLFSLLLACLTFLIVLISTAQADISPPLMDDKENEQEAGIRVAYHSETGRLTFLGSNPAQPIIVRSAMAKGMLPQERAVALMQNFGQL
ncbi:MAG: hypothetical protein ACXADB_12405, partial [Candidatus Hermodarchaeia archaeon]